MEAHTHKSQKKACITCGQEYDDATEICPFDKTKLTVLATQLAPGTVLSDRYEILETVADGGMGKVYKARHKLMNRNVAIKTMQPSLVASGSALKRFQQEVQAISLLNHPNVLTVFDFFISDDGLPYMVMDYLEGTNLDEIRKTEGAIDPDRAIRIFIMACAGLAHAHEKGIIHRDIKPANIMLVNFDGMPDFVKIIDFGIAKVAPTESEGINLTATGDVFGSPLFMSPEQCRAKPLDARSDVYSLGCVMYAAVSGKSPFTGTDPIECMYRQVHETPLPFQEVCAGMQLPEGLEEAIFKAVAKEPDDRFQSMAEFRRTLEDIAGISQTQSGSMRLTTGMRKPEISQHLQVPEPVLVAPENLSTGTHKPPKDLEMFSKHGIWGAVGFLVAAMLLMVFLADSDHKRMNEASTDRQPPATNTAPNAVRGKKPASTTTTTVTTITRQTHPHFYPPVGTPTPDNPAAQYSAEMAQGEKAYQAGKHQDAQQFFRMAHHAASGFGEGDPRFTESLLWQARTAYKLGQFQVAKSAYEWVLYWRKSHYGANAPQTKAIEEEISKVKKALGLDTENRD